MAPVSSYPRSRHRTPVSNPSLSPATECPVLLCFFMPGYGKAWCWVLCHPSVPNLSWIPPRPSVRFHAARTYKYNSAAGACGIRPANSICICLPSHTNSSLVDRVPTY
ncbi:hypothetical protein N657DRAFT_256129 [Parathielavia appendiculata]|uniref:Uncharacterized protein n=1 Tax=Parathielavia appendiculata TaxID=2587402 RepID=A0AAN6TRM4_9PEZI|nr:hypothetical protein N657DRAFT_256129 [Parathielavia appendiculata]